jgi:large subunit ribosomal protein L10
MLRTMTVALVLVAAVLLDSASCAAMGARAAPARAVASVARADALMRTLSTNTANLAKKQDTIDGVKARLDASSLIFTFRSDGVPVNKLRGLRDAMPASSSIVMVKNRLMKRAIQGTKWDHLDSLLDNSNYWAFVPEDDIKPSIDAVQDFLKSIKRIDGKGKSQTEHPTLGDKTGVQGGVFDGEFLDVDGIVRVSKLPTKLELITQIAIGINQVPTKLARSIKEVPAMLARGVKLAKCADGAEEEAPAAVEEVVAAVEEVAAEAAAPAADEAPPAEESAA